MEERADTLLVAHAKELLRRAAGGELVYTAFLTPREEGLLTRALAPFGGTRCLCGGYAEAERCRMVFLPDYLAELPTDCRDEALSSLLADALVPVEILGSGYRTLTHRDYLGAVLNLGISRSAVGDVAVLSEHRAVLFCDSVIAAFLKETLTRVAQDAVKVNVIALPEGFDGGRRFEPVTDTVASPRADAVVAALCHLPRERAQALFARGLVELDYEVLEKYDKEVTEGATLTVRGYGKFRVRSLCDKTKKGRYRLLADRYI